MSDSKISEREDLSRQNLFCQFRWLNLELVAETFVFVLLNIRTSSKNVFEGDDITG